MNGETKTYIRVYHRQDGDPGYGKGSLEFVTTKPAEAFKYDTTANTLVYDYDGNNAYYMGTYSTFTTFSVSNTSYITGNKANTVDVSQFPARFYTVGNSETPDEPDVPVVPDEPDVPDVPVEPTQSASMSFATTEQRVSHSSEEQVWSANGITVTNLKDTSITDIFDSSAQTHVRWYNGSTVTVEHPGMCHIVF